MHYLHQCYNRHYRSDLPLYPGWSGRPGEETDEEATRVRRHCGPCPCTAIGHEPGQCPGVLTGAATSEPVSAPGREPLPEHDPRRQSGHQLLRAGPTATQHGEVHPATASAAADNAATGPAVRSAGR